jgi:hypothetical protein
VVSLEHKIEEDSTVTSGRNLVIKLTYNKMCPWYNLLMKEKQEKPTVQILVGRRYPGLVA